MTSTIENLKRRKIKYESDRSIDIAQIDTSKTQIRTDSTEDMDYIEQMVVTLKNGGELPPILVYYDKSTRKYILLGGWHRYQAHLKADRKNIVAVVILDELLDQDRDMIAFEDNDTNSKALTESDRLMWALYWHRNGYTIDTAAKKARIGRDKLQRAILRSDVAAEVAADLAPAIMTKMSKHLYRFNPIVKTEHKVRAVALAHSAGFSGDQIDDMQRQIKKAAKVGDAAVADVFKTLEQRPDTKSRRIASSDGAVKAPKNFAPIWDKQIAALERTLVERNNFAGVDSKMRKAFKARLAAVVRGF